jgi:GTP-binding protein HflX
MAVVTDTVGFIRKLPPQLIEAFKATLEESAEADILIHVIDLSSPSMNRQIEVVDDLIEEFGWNNKPIIHVFNKVDIAPVDRQFKVNRHPRVFVSALTGQGLDQLKTLMSEKIGELQMDAQLYFPRSQEHRIFDLSRETRILKKEAASEGTLCYAQLTTQMASRWRDFLVK